MSLVLETPHSLRDLVGRELILTDWFPIAQERIEQFAEVTEDRQWIHVDRAGIPKGIGTNSHTNLINFASRPHSGIGHVSVLLPIWAIIWYDYREARTRANPSRSPTGRALPITLLEPNSPLE